ncbi:MAG: flavodoxin-dependent (E)-4-hydroxy-3-methylbut-2-enyl-diphosphate synthase [Candidatus Omnitrophota bacterium]|nr:flavodoxin-dependent (E)-4-hydroxy-3-methylbut-2-enyl-diphosphate synthase [Candidatus Omnitrophota bacterium]
MQIDRHKTREIKIGRVKIGGSNPIIIQSMVKVDTKDVDAVVRQIKSLEKSGCEIIRVTVKDKESAAAISKIKRKINIPLVADIHFDYKLALLAIKNGADKIRLNPGNIFKARQIKTVAEAAKKAGIPIRVGVNSGSVKKEVSGVRGQGSSVERMVKSAQDYIKMLEGFGFYNIVVSLKASNILDTIEAYRKMAKLTNYPLHLGLTATGSPYAGAIKSSIALGALLLEGIGDTIRVSLTEKPQDEVSAAKVILGSLGLRNFGPEIISCPTCGRCEVNLVNIVNNLEKRLSAKRYPLNANSMKVAVMGCVVNGPGEAREADIGIAFGKKDGLLFKHGKPIKKVSANKCVEVLLKEIFIK